jgi:transcriptional regulator with XRE-family HTH domain
MAEKHKIAGEFGTVLRTYRIERGMTQEQLSEQLDIVRSYICTLESGKRQPSLTMVFRLAAALGVKPGELVNAVSARLEK